jgi:large subunit ribosomal protein L32
MWPRRTARPVDALILGAIEGSPAMPHPKRRISKQRKRIRRSHLALEVPQLNMCPRCGSAKKSHRVCDNCGFYGFAKGGQRGTAVIEKDEF